MKFMFIFVIGFLAIGVCYFFGIRPSHDRNWMKDQEILPHIVIDGNKVTIENIRNFSYRSATDYDINYYTQTYDLNHLKRVWFIVEPFQKMKSMAHTQLSFEFEGPRFLAVSIETRREVGEETYSWLKGFFRRYELMYIIAYENDAIKLRTNIRHHDVYLYPVLAPESKVRELFLDMMLKAQEIETKPEFYNTLINNCTYTIVRHVRKIAPHSIPLNLKILLPGYVEGIAYGLGLIDNSEPFEIVKKRHLISSQARKWTDGEDFSVFIRKNIEISNL